MRAAITVTITFSPPSCANASDAIHPDEIPELHRRAGLWEEADGCLSGAIEHALAAEDFDRAADLIEEETGVRRTYVDASLLLRWLGTLPDDLVRRRPQLSLLYAWALAHSGALEDGRAPAPGYRGGPGARRRSFDGGTLR